MSKQKTRKLYNASFIEISGTYTAKGCESEFYETGSVKYGIKIYKKASLAQESYERQKLAASHGLAPKVGKFLIVKKKPGSKIYYGYQTEKAKDVEITDEIYKKQSSKLYENLVDLGLGGDFGDVNCGVLRGKLVAIDFGSHSESEW